MTPYEQGFTDKCAELGVTGDRVARLFKSAAQEGQHAVAVPVSEMQDYLSRYKALDEAPVANPLKHMGVGGVAGSSLGAALAALLGGKKAVLGGAALGGLSGVALGATTGSIKAIRDMLRSNRRKRELSRAFAERHGMDPNRTWYMNP